MRDKGLAELIPHDGSGKFLGHAVLERPLRPTPILLPPQGLNPFVNVSQCSNQCSVTHTQKSWPIPRVSFGLHSRGRSQGV
jgi:hypothetical protein